MSVSLETNGKPRVSFSLPTIAAFCSILSVLIYCVGFVTGYMAYTRSMSDLKIQNDKIAERLSAVETKVTETQGDVKYIGQSIAELKLAVVPKR